MMEMKEYQKRTVMLNSTDAVERFVFTARKCEFSIDVCKSHFKFVIDGKSLLGMMAVLGNEMLEVYYDGNSPEFEEMLGQYEVCGRELKEA